MAACIVVGHRCARFYSCSSVVYEPALQVRLGTGLVHVFYDWGAAYSGAIPPR